jgi:hypothetical protein
MARMRRFGILILLASAPLYPAQDQPAKPAATAAPKAPAAVKKSPPAPAAVDRALRARVTGFFQAHVDGKFRQAEQYVAPEARDFFYSAVKPHYLKFEISKITYSDHNTKATVVTRCDREVMSPMGKMTFNIPEESNWKVERGLWYWYANQKEVRTPVGATKYTPGLPGQQENRGDVLKPQVASVQDLWKLVSADKKEVRLPVAGGSDSLAVRNSLKGFVTIKVQAPDMPGLEISIDHERIAPNYSSRVTFKYQPPPEAKAPPKNLPVEIHVDPSNEIIPIQVIFAEQAAGK